jgi:hypothetical protein
MDCCRMCEELVSTDRSHHPRPHHSVHVGRESSRCGGVFEFRFGQHLVGLSRCPTPRWPIPRRRGRTETTPSRGTALTRSAGGARWCRPWPASYYVIVDQRGFLRFRRRRKTRKLVQRHPAPWRARCVTSCSQHVCTCAASTSSFGMPLRPKRCSARRSSAASSLCGTPRSEGSSCGSN